MNTFKLIKTFYTTEWKYLKKNVFLNEVVDSIYRLIFNLLGVPHSLGKGRMKPVIGKQ